MAFDGRIREIIEATAAGLRCEVARCNKLEFGIKGFYLPRFDLADARAILEGLVGAVLAEEKRRAS